MLRRRMGELKLVEKYYIVLCKNYAVPVIFRTGSRKFNYLPTAEFI
jgi:hypothetical protein